MGGASLTSRYHNAVIFEGFQRRRILHRALMMQKDARVSYRRGKSFQFGFNLSSKPDFPRDFRLDFSRDFRLDFPRDFRLDFPRDFGLDFSRDVWIDYARDFRLDILVLFKLRLKTTGKIKPKKVYGFCCQYFSTSRPEKL